MKQEKIKSKKRPGNAHILGTKSLTQCDSNILRLAHEAFALQLYYSQSQINFERVSSLL